LLNATAIFAKQQSEVLNFEDLTLQISLPKQNFVKLEPIPIAIEIVNNKTYPITGHFYTDFSAGFTKLLVGTDQENLIEVSHNLSLRTASVKGDNKLINPKERQRNTQVLALKLEKIFPTMGKYYLRLQMEDFTGKQKVVSNILQIEIAEPSGDNLAAFAYMKQHTRVDFFFTPLNSVNKLQYFVENFSSSVYGTHATFTLANIKLATGEYEEATKHLEFLLEDKSFTLTEVVLLNLVQANLKIGNRQKAAKYFETLKNKFPNSATTKKSSLLMSSLGSLQVE
jgi:tetratricopeptide (TPR) repeat protein